MLVLRPLVVTILVGILASSYGASLPLQAPVAQVSEVDVPVDAGPVIIVLEQQEQNQVEPVQDPPSLEVGEPADFVENQPPLGVSDVPDEKKPSKPSPAPAKPQKPAGKPQPAKPQKPAQPPAKPQKPSTGKPQKPATPAPSKPQKPGQKPQKPAGKPEKPQKPAGKPQKPAGKPEKPAPNRPQRPTPKPQRPSGTPNKPGKPNKTAGDESDEYTTTNSPIEYDYELTTPEEVLDLEAVETAAVPN